ncbi:type II toxin-antitoxin system VapC family toxin [Sphingomonas sp. NPDC092331]|jgi:ribonuclease VapC|uniref:type II toxin-antitoxin system VapC family toxin n=2 Tax=Sphingomonas TaxID=13687 RepID=UPI0029EEDCAB|nr:type II toxin-antitoxin system VapC family toxin [Pseudomonadota bacterium]
MMAVLDASAVLAMLLDEPGADMVADAIRTAELSIINYAEAMAKTAENGGDLDLTERILFSSGVRVRAFREGHAMEAAKLRPVTKHLGLSFGDRACLVQGRFSNLPILTADARMASADIGLDIRMIR